MKLNIYTIYDEKAAAYLNPFFLQNDNMAIRTIAEIMHDGTHAFTRFASDYTLYYLGEYDNTTGVFMCEKRLVFTLLEIRALYAQSQSMSLPFAKEN